MSAGEALTRAALGALAAVTGLSGRYEGPPIQAAFPYAVVTADLESDWSHKSGAGREVRLAVTIRDRGESPARTRALASAAEVAMAGVQMTSGPWLLVSLAFLRRRLLAEPGGGWIALIEYRARMLAQ